MSPMWLDYKGKRHFLPTEMPEEPNKNKFNAMPLTMIHLLLAVQNQNNNRGLYIFLYF
jgi:hypothetical protein